MALIFSSTGTHESALTTKILCPATPLSIVSLRMDMFVKPSPTVVKPAHEFGKLERIVCPFHGIREVIGLEWLAAFLRRRCCLSLRREAQMGRER